MKNVLKYLAIVIFILSTLPNAEAQSNLAGIENRIANALDSAFKNTSSEALDVIMKELYATENGGGQHWVEYWTAYLQLQKSVYSAYGAKSEEEAQRWAGNGDCNIRTCKGQKCRRLRADGLY